MTTFRQRGRENTAKVLLDNFNPSRDHSYFLGIGNSVTSAVSPIPQTEDTIQADHLIWDNLFFMNAIIRSDVSLMIKRYDWEAGTTYQPFNKDINQYDSSDRFYVFNSQNRCVYLCMASPSNENQTSEYPPIGINTEPEVKLDGYTWKFLYQISEEDLEKFDYPGYIPIQEVGTDLYTDMRVYQQNVAASAIRGAIESIDVYTQGNAYAGAVNPEFVNPLYTIASVSGTSSNPEVLVDQTGRYELIVSSGFYDNKYVMYFENGYTALIQSSNIDSDTGLLKLVLCNLDLTNPALPPQHLTFSILPRVEIIGNGTGAIAVPVLTTDKLISRIRMVKNGSNYSYVEAKISVENGTVITPLIGLNGLASNVTELLGATRLMISKKIKPTTSLSQGDPVIYSLPENTAVVYNGNEYNNVISPNTFYTQLSLIKSPKKLVSNLEQIAGTSIIEIREMLLEAIDPMVTITIGTTTNPFTNSSNFFEIDDIITRGPDNYPDQFRAVINEINVTGYSTQLVCSLINGAFETYSGYRIKNLKNTATDTTDDTEFVFLDCNNNCSSNIFVVYTNTFKSSDFINDNSLFGTTSFSNAEIITPTTGYAYVNPLYPTRAKIRVKNVDSGFLPARYENGEYISGEVVSSVRVVNGVPQIIKSGKLASISDVIQTIGDDSILGYAYILECTIDRGIGNINTPYELVNSDSISLETNTLIRQGTTGTVGKIIRTAIPSGTGDTDKLYLYVNNYNGSFVVGTDNLYIIDDLYNPTSYTNMKLQITDIIYEPTLVRYSGKILYINDAGPVQRRIENTENLKLLVEF